MTDPYRPTPAYDHDPPEPEVTTEPAAGPAAPDDYGLLDRARAALHVAERYGELTPDQSLQLGVAGASAGKIQGAYLRHASTLALVAIAESLAGFVAAWEADAEADRNHDDWLQHRHDQPEPEAAGVFDQIRDGDYLDSETGEP
jgi:hypothetical protein